MAAPTLKLENNREHLLQAIVDVLQSWPENHRRIFTEAHYQGKSLRDIARTAKLGVREVEEVLARRERELRAALRRFRDAGGYPAMGESRAAEFSLVDSSSLDGPFELATEPQRHGG